VTRSLRTPLLGVLAAIAVTTAMDAAGLSAFSALALFPLLLLFAFLERFSRRDMGFTPGDGRSYLVAAAYPVAVLGALAVLAALAGAVDTSQADWGRALRNLAVVSVSTFLVAIVTEEGFFRGWLFASLDRAGAGEARILLWSSVAFSLWHVSAVLLPTDFAPAPAQVPVYLVNAAVIGVVWGLMRRASGSVLVSSLSHGLWNGGAYVLFGFGKKAGTLGIRDTALFGPEVGVLGLALNVALAALLWRRWKSARAIAAALR
jgi:membrane protease YdiL (CAAX protease family)